MGEEPGQGAQRPAGPGGQGGVREQRLRELPHVQPAGATGKVGPDLDKLPAYAKQAGKPLEAFVKESIVDPNAYVQPGFPKGVMPPFNLPADQLDALVSYLTKGSK